MTLKEKAEKLFESMEHFITPYDEERFIKFVKQEIKELGDKMIWKKEEYVDKNYTYLDTEYNSNAVRYGINEKRQEMINVLRRYFHK